MATNFSRGRNPGKMPILCSRMNANARSTVEKWHALYHLPATHGTGPRTSGRYPGTRPARASVMQGPM